MSHQLFTIHELVEAICEASVIPPQEPEGGQDHDDFEIEEDIVVPEILQRELVMLARVNKFIGEIASKILWRRPFWSLEPFLMLFPEDYLYPILNYTLVFAQRFVKKMPPEIADYERFIHYSQYVQYLDYGECSQCRPIPEVVFNDYFALFPTRPVFPRLKALTWYIEETSQLRFLIHSGIKSLQLDRPLKEQERQPEEITATDLQESLPNLVRLRDLIPLSERVSEPGPDPAETPFQKGMDSVLQNWTHLRHLEVSRLLSDFTTLFTTISKLQRLQYLKIVVAQRDEPIQPSSDGLKPALDVVHTASKLDIEGELEDLHLALRICSTGTQLTCVGLLFYPFSDTDKDPPLDYFFLPPTLSQKQLTELTINGYGYDLGYDYPKPDWKLPCSVFSTLATPRSNFTAIQIETPYSLLITESFLDLIAETSPALKTFIMLTRNPHIDRSPHNHACVVDSICALSSKFIAAGIRDGYSVKGRA
ncbi:hypothetical protein M408DRAFT_26224 [Serendipita vermifera MAFF 305830]|uniref:Uncharacterized protein n=1 Tax=Serendipita vermifera MAFF 305830 TaxID=933852 RepID=A0A0C3B1L4_SERVB|nr:hypothetical protein M408DRAFT_26224 [Serendipita vermifera MAFF 305830]